MRIKYFFVFLLSLCFSLSSLLPAQRVLRLDLKENRLPFGLTELKAKNFPKVALVFSGGGARGLTQIGVLRALEENKIPFDMVVGTSMGSILGGLASAGYSNQELDSIVQNTAWEKFSSAEESDRMELFVDQKVTKDRAILTLRLNGLRPILPTSINTGQKFSNFLNLLTLNAPIHGDSSFSDLKYNYTAVSTDLVRGKRVILRDGSLSQAMRASASVSFLLAPVNYDSLTLVDGGLVENVPVRAALDCGANYIIAVNTTSPLHTKEELTRPWNLADQLLSIPMKEISDRYLGLADVLITPQIGYKLNTDFTNISETIEEGYRTALPYINEILKGIKAKCLKNLEDSRFFVKRLHASANPTESEKRILRLIQEEDSVSSSEIYYQLYKEFSSGNYADLYATLTKDSIGTEFRIHSELNPTVKEIRLNGVTIIGKDETAKLISPLIGLPYNSRRLLDFLTDIMRLYRHKGLSLAEIENVHFNLKTGTISVVITEGKILEIDIEGNSKTNRTVIERELPFVQGDYFRYEKLNTGLKNLLSTNLFDDIEFKILKSEPDNILQIRVKERISQIIRVGLRIDDENKAQISLDLREENLLGTGTEVGAIFSGGIANRSYILEHKANRIFDTYFTYKLRAFYDMSDISFYQNESQDRKNENRIKTAEYRQKYYGFSLGLGTQLGKFASLIAEGRLQTDKIESNYNFKENEYSLNLRSLRFLLNIDSQDRYPFPREGFLVKSYYETAQQVLGGQLGYTKIYFDYKNYFTFHKYNTIGARFAIGFADETTPLSQQYSLGGQNQFYGLRENEFRGRQILISSLEYRLKSPIDLFFDTYFKVRYDLGSIWASKEQIRLQDLRHGMGTALAFDTPVGPADFAIGKSFSLRDGSNGRYLSWSPFYFYFTIGFYY